MSSYETIILGSSPDALTAAAYLARSGQKVLVLEPTAYTGGAVSTQEFAEGFRADTGLLSGRIAAKVADDLKLSAHGLEVIERQSITSLLPDKRSFTLTSDLAKAKAAISKFAPDDAEKYEKFMHLLALATDFLQSAYKITPPDSRLSPTSELQLSELVAKLRGYGKREMTEVMRLLVMSARHFLDEWFSSEELKGLLATPAVRGLAHGPFAGSTTFTLLHHLAIGDGYFRATAKGGVGKICKALAACAQSHGAQIETNATVKRIVLSDGVATGVELEGEQITANRIVSAHDAGYLFKHLIRPFDLEPEFNRALGHVRYKGCVARLNLALEQLPSFTGVDEDALRGTLVVAPSMSYLERAHDKAKYGNLSDAPYLEVTVPSLSDPSLAPAGKHVMSIWFQYAPYRNADDAREIERLALSSLQQHCPNLSAQILHTQVLTAHDFEKQFNLTEGHLYGSEMSLTQAFYLRPIPGFGQYRSPIENLYLCGSATHPGGGISGLSGHNLVNELGGVKEVALAGTGK